MPTFQNEKNITSPYSRKQGQEPQPSRRSRRSTRTRSTKTNVDFPVPKSSLPQSSPSPFVQSQQNKDDPIETSLSHTGDSSPSAPDEPSSPSPPPAQVIETSYLDFLNRVRSGTEPTFHREDIDNQGRVYIHDDFIRIPDPFLLAPPPPPRSEADKKVNYKNHFLDEFYGNGDPALFETDVILTVDDTDAKEYNDLALNKFCTKHQTLSSKFRTTCKTDRDNVWEFWDFMRQSPPIGSCLPPLKLRLGVGMPIILLQDVHHGGSDLPAGTRLIVIAFHEAYILARVPAGNIDQVIIRRQSYKVSSGCSPEIWHIREQFPVKRAFALAADDVPNRVMFEGVGLDLKHPFKRPGKLSTALSRCRDPRRLKVYTPGGEGYTRNARRV
ncbi:MAG: hypothetical protein J3R72DRAFT_181318 [Linnemannia gamsii]|nr:MAG: hypothetical protein J3R72DRAFT_181318 [Linnemannia gamsii]